MVQVHSILSHMLQLFFQLRRIAYYLCQLIAEIFRLVKGVKYLLLQVVLTFVLSLDLAELVF